jgi:hypothetical protein
LMVKKLNTINDLGKITVEPPKSRRTETEMAPTEPYANRLEAFESQLKVN